MSEIVLGGALLVLASLPWLAAAGARGVAAREREDLGAGRLGLFLAAVGWVALPAAGLAWLAALSFSPRFLMLTWTLGPAGMIPAALPVAIVAVLTGALVDRALAREIAGVELEIAARLGRQVRLVVGLAAAMAAMEVMRHGGPGSSLVAGTLLVAVVIATSTSRVLPGAFAMGEGPTRARIAGFAGDLGIELREIAVVPAALVLPARVVAGRSRSIVLGEGVVDCLSTRELDALAACDLVRIKPGRRAAGVGAACAGLATFSLPDPLTMLVMFVPGLGFFGPLFTQLMTVRAGLGALVYVAATHWLRRRADDAAIEITQDPGSLAGALEKLARRGLVESAASGLDEQVCAYAAVMGRLRRVVARHGVDLGARVADLAEAPRVEPAPATRAAVVPLLFGAAERSRVGGKATLHILGAILLVPLLFAHLGQAAGLAGVGAWLVAAVAAGLTLLLATHSRFTIAWDYGRLAARLRERHAGTRELASGLYVAFSPGAHPRVYQSFFDADVGLLHIEPGSLRYAGDAVSFTLPRDAIRGLAVGPGAPGLGSSPRVYIAWQAGDAGGTLSLRPMLPAALLLKPGVEAFLRMLEAWSASGAPSLPVPPGELPSNDAMGGKDPSLQASGTHVATQCAAIAFCSGNLASLTGLPLLGAGPWSALAVALVSAGTILVMLLPYHRYTDR